jgi:hypothetical protein
MDFTSLAALVGALGTLISASTAFFKLWSASQRRQLLNVVITAVFLISGICAVAGGFGLYYKYVDLKKTTEQSLKLMRIFSGFGAVELVSHADNCVKKVLFRDDIPIPNSIQQYLVTPSKTLEKPEPTYNIRLPNDSQYLFFQSEIRQDQCGWSNVAIIARDAVNLKRYRNLVFVIESIADDILEIKIKDESNAVDLCPLLVRKGWGEYILPLALFRNVNLDLISELGIAHSCPFRRDNKELLENPVFKNTFRLLLVSPCGS